MTLISKRFNLNYKLFVSISCVMLICTASLLIIERNCLANEGAVESIVKVPEPKCLKPHECYQRITSGRHNEYEIKLLEDVMDAEPNPNTGENIFFHETTCSKTGLVDLNSREACAIESAAKMHPERNVFVLFASPVGFRDNVSNFPTTIEVLKTYPNVHFRNNDLWKYAEDTPLEKWLNDGTLFQSKYLPEHMSDILRYLTLYKFGGTYLDLDVIVQQNFDHLGKNFAGDDSDDAIGCGVLNFAKDSVGNNIAGDCLRYVIGNFNGKIFIDNGPRVITKTLERICGTKKRQAMTREQCGGFQLYPQNTFYAVQWGYWRWLFDPAKTNHTLGMTMNSTVVHAWNDVSKNTVVTIGANSVYELTAKLNCPKVYQSRLNYERF